MGTLNGVVYTHITSRVKNTATGWASIENVDDDRLVLVEGGIGHDDVVPIFQIRVAFDEIRKSLDLVFSSDESGSIWAQARQTRFAAWSKRILGPVNRGIIRVDKCW